MAISADYLLFVLDQLTQLGHVSSRRMFGGAGLYRDELFFGLIADDTLYLRVDDSNRDDYTARGMGAFRPRADRTQLSMNYFEVPADVLENARQLSEWARRSVEVARRALVKAKGSRPARSARWPRAPRGT